jgi:hypothetical protein
VASLAALGDSRFQGHFSFVVLVGKLPDTLRDLLTVGDIDISSCHIFGANDPFVDYYAPKQSVTIVHPKVHTVPALDQSQTEELRAFLLAHRR